MTTSQQILNFCIEDTYNSFGEKTSFLKEYVKVQENTVLDKILVGQNYLSDKILVTSKKLVTLSPTNNFVQQILNFFFLIKLLVEQSFSRTKLLVGQSFSRTKLLVGQIFSRTTFLVGHNLSRFNKI